MPQIQISDSTMQKLQELAIPLEDTFDTLLDRLVDAAQRGVPYPKRNTSTKVCEPLLAQDNEPTDIDTIRQIDLKFTRIINAEFAGIKLLPPNWNELHRLAHKEVLKRLGNFEKLQESTNANIKKGRYQEKGYIYIKSANISIQGVDAIVSWRNCVQLAEAINQSVVVEVEWKNEPKAAYPGRKLRITYPQDI